MDQYPDDYVDEGAIRKYIDELHAFNANQVQQEGQIQVQVRKEEKIREFKKQLTNVMNDDIEKNGAKNGIFGVGAFLQDGHVLTEAYKRDLKHEASIKLEKYRTSMSKTKVAQADCFGVSRRFCRICTSQCSGYEASDSNFGGSMNEMRGEFPTFCKLCQCPSFFHSLEGAPEKQDTVESSQSDQGNLVVEFPDEFASLLKTNNLRSQDVNFNCVLAVFEQTSENIMKELQELMKSEGIEIINHVTKELTPQEMFFLKNRIEDAEAKKLAKQNGNFFQNVNGHNELKLNGGLDELMLNMMSQGNPLSKRKTIMNQMKKEVTGQLSGNLNTQNLDTIFEEAGEQSEDADINRDLGRNTVLRAPPNLESTLNGLLEVQKKILAFKPPKSAKTKGNYQFERGKEKKGGQKARVNERINEVDQLEQMANYIQGNDLMKSMNGQQYVIMVFNSSLYQGMYAKVQALVKGVVKMIYNSNTKIQAFEDCITFMPQLFRLSKSILVSENITTFHDQMSRFGGTTGFTKSEVKPTHLEEKFMTTKRETNHYNQNPGLAQQAALGKFMACLKEKQDQENESLFSKIRTLEKSQRARSKEKVSTRVAQHVVQKYTRKDEKLKDVHFKMMYNYGMIVDFLNYSGMSVQMTIQCGDMAKPPHPAGIRGGLISMASFNLMSSQPCNIFAIAKVGVPNLIMPNTLDVKFSNYENFDSYVEISDLFFPENSKNQITVAILRPQMIKSGLNHLLCQILKANEFSILKRIVRSLSKAEVGYLLHSEKIHDNNHALYFDLMMDGPVEILALSKMGAVSDLKTLFHGSNPFGRRRTNQSNEGQDIRANVDSTNAMFEIAPFTSFNELIDLQDFIIRNSTIAKYQKFLEPSKKKEEQKNDFVASKKAQILTQITLFQRFFNLVGYCSDNEQVGGKDIQIFFPKLAHLEEVILILNPLYSAIEDHAMELLVRLGYTFIFRQPVKLTPAQSQKLFEKKLIHHTAYEREVFYKLWEDEPINVFHLSKIAGLKELKRIYQTCGLQISDTLVHKQFGFPLKPERIPHLFYFLDEEQTFEAGLELIYNPSLLAYQGKDFLKKFSKQEIYSILQTNFTVNVGDTIKMMQFDTKTGTLHDKNYYTDARDNFSLLNQLKNFEERGLEPQFFPQFNNFGHHQPYQSVKVETHCSGVYQIRFRNLQIWDKPETIKPMYASLLLYYQEVNKVSCNICPTFYKFKIAKNEKQKIKRALEIEESMGDPFIEMMGRLHGTQAQIQTQSKRDGRFESIPAYVYSKRLSEMCKLLQTIQTPQSVKGAGKIIYDFSTKCLRGEVENPANFFKEDIQKYRGYLENFRIGWRHFLGVLEIELIEEKIAQILGSKTFEHTRDPKFLKLAPDRITSQNLRVAEKIHILDPTSLDLNSNEKFFKHLKDQVLDPNREKEIYDKVSSVLQTIKMLSLQPVNKQLKPETLFKDDTGIERQLQDDDRHFKTIKHHFDQQEKIQKELMVQRNVAISGFQDGICVKPKHHLIANLLWIFNFELKKQNRRQELFQTSSKDRDLHRLSQEYDDVLDTLHEQIIKTYFEDEPEAFDVIASMQVQGGVVKESDFELNMRIKKAEEERIKEIIAQEAEWANRKKRATMTIDELIQFEIYDKAEAQRKKEKEKLIKELHAKSDDPMGDAFKRKLAESGMMLGPHASKIAVDDVIKQRAIQASKNRPGTYLGQENIHLVMMEYFLFGMQEANLLIEELATMERIQTKWTQVIDQLDSLMMEEEAKRQGAMSEQRTQYAYSFESLKIKKQEFTLMYDDLLKQINDQQEQLVKVFRELAMCNFQVPKNYFEEWHRMQLQRAGSEQFNVDIKTFWRPLELPNEPKVVRNVDSQSWAKRIGIHKLVVATDEMLNSKRTQRGEASQRFNIEKIPFGRFLSQAQRDHFLYCPEHQKDKKDSDTCEFCIKKLQTLIPKGMLDNQLRTPDEVAKPDAISFDKFWTKGQIEQHLEIDKIAQLVKEKNQKEAYKPAQLKLERE